MGIRALARAALALALVAGMSTGVSWGAPGTCDGLEPTIVGTEASDELRGTTGADVIAGLGGDDVIVGRRGNDVVCGGAGGDRLEGDDGDDRLFGEGGTDSFSLGDGADLAVGGAGDFNFFEWSPGDDTYDGSAGAYDLIDHYSAPNAVIVDLPSGSIDGVGNDAVAGIEHAYGSNFDDTMTGDEGFNHFAGRGGNDTLIAGGGGVLSGAGPGWSVFAYSNVLVGEGGNDTLVGGDGYDAVSFFDSPAVTVDLEAGTAQGEGDDALSGIEGIITSRGDSTVLGDDGDNAFAVSGSAASIDGRGGNDLVIALYAFAGNQLIGAEIDLAAGTLDAGDSGSTALLSIEDAWGTATGDTIRGTEGPNDLRGRGGNDKIYGRAGDDRLDGGRGRRDLLSGGAGTDACVRGERLRGCET